jgi:hypothetical protein
MMEFDSLREIRISLDTYDDIFSDFDPRPYSQRELSEDFLKEIQQRYLETPQGRIEVHFDLPAGKRDTRLDATAKKRIREHFEIERKREEAKILHTKWKGVKYVAFGSLALVAATLPLLEWPDSILVNIASTVLTPVAWFFSFTGASIYVDDWKESRDRANFCLRFEKANYVFVENEAIALNTLPSQTLHGKVSVQPETPERVHDV